MEGLYFRVLPRTRTATLGFCPGRAWRARPDHPPAHPR